MIAIVIVGLLMAIAVPAFQKIRETTLVTSFGNDLRVYRDTMELFLLEGNPLPANPSSGTIAPAFADYLPSSFTHRTPLGGSWDVQVDASGIRFGVGAHLGQNGDPMPSNTVLTRVDRMLDDGDISQGGLRMLAGDRFYSVIVE